MFAAAVVIILTVPSSYSQEVLNLELVVQTTLDRSVPIRESVETVKLRAAELQIFEGAFDVVVGLSAEGGRANRLFSDVERSIYNVASAYTGVSSYRLAAVRRTRSGITISPALQVSRQDALTLTTPSVVRTEAALEISYPIFNAGKRSPESADVSSAHYALKASRYHERHARALSVYRAGVAYWAYVGAYESLDILNASEERARQLLAETQALVEGGERASSDLDQLRADRADRFAARMAAEQHLFEARMRLGLEMGMKADEAVDLPPPSGFPDLPGAPPPIDVESLVSLAASRRADLATMEYTVHAAADARYARAIEARPRLDLLVSIGHASLSENRLTLRQHLPLFGQNHVNGTSGSLALVLTWPTTNRRARGQLERQKALWRQAQIARDDVARRIRSGLMTASEQLQSTIEELEKVNEAVDLYAASVENERKKLQLGMSTQFDVILVEERHRNSLLARVAARMRYAEAVVRLRFEAGTLLTDEIGPREIAKRLLSPATVKD